MFKNVLTIKLIGNNIIIKCFDNQNIRNFKEDLGVDSLDLFELVMALEEAYGIEIPSDDLENITTVGAVMDYLKEKGVEA